MILIVDTETTGLAPLNQKGKGYINPSLFLDWNDCRLVQIAWIICDEIGGIKVSKEYIIKPKYYIIPEEATKIHGITQEMAKATGVKIEIVLKEFMDDLTKCNLLVGHNLNFDYHVILSELYRIDMNITKIVNISKYCTMENGKIDDKYIKQSELYKKYFNIEPKKTLHRAINDVELCKDIYFYQQEI